LSKVPPSTRPDNVVGKAVGGKETTYAARIGKAAAGVPGFPVEPLFVAVTVPWLGSILRLMKEPETGEATAEKTAAGRLLSWATLAANVTAARG